TPPSCPRKAERRGNSADNRTRRNRRESPAANDSGRLRPGISRSVTRDDGAAEAIAQPEPDGVDVDIMGTRGGIELRQSHIFFFAQVDVEIFHLCGPVRGDCELDTAAQDPAVMALFVTATERAIERRTKAGVDRRGRRLD